MLAPTSMMVIYSKLGRDRRPRLSVKNIGRRRVAASTGMMWFKVSRSLSSSSEAKDPEREAAAARLTDEELPAQAIFGPSPHEKKDQKQKYQILLPLLLRDE